MDPYRDVAAIERAGPARLIAEPEPPPSRRLRASAFSDGTTRIRIHQGRARVAAFTALGLWWHVTLLLTRDLLFAGSHALDGAITAFARGGSAADIRLAASRAYAAGEHKPLARVQSLFTN